MTLATDMPPEMLFNRYFTNHTALQVQLHYSKGIAMTLDVGDSVLGESIEAARNEINLAAERNASTVTNSHGATQVHLDFVNSDKLNAIAFVYEGRPFIAVTTALIRRLVEISSQMWRLNLVAPMLGIVLDHDTRNRFAATLILIQLQILASHELGHHVHGHCAADSDGNIAEFAFVDSEAVVNSVDNRLRDQAMEVEADGYAVHHMLKNLFDGGIGGNIHRILDSRKEVEDFILNYFLLAIGSLFYLMGTRKFATGEVYAYEHPPALARLNVMLRDFNGWLSLNRPDLVGWATLERFQAVMTAVSAAAEGAIDQTPWDAEGAFLLSPEGQRYTDELYAVRDALRIEMNLFHWDVPISNGVYKKEVA